MTGCKGRAVATSVEISLPTKAFRSAYSTARGFEMANRVAIVTGGTRGIGEAIARRLAVDSFRVFISGTTEKSVRAALQRYAKDGLDIHGFPADARKEEDQKRLVQSAAREGGRLDVLVNNAGLGHFAPVDKLTPAQFRETLETNLFGSYYAVHYAAPLM